MMRGVRHWAVAVRKPLRESEEASSEGSEASKAGSAPEASNGRNGVGGSHGERPSSQEDHTANAQNVSHSFDVAFAREAELSREEEQGQLEELGEIEVVTFPLTSALVRHRWLRLPILRGIVALGGSLAIGFRALGISANAQLPEGEAEEEPQEIGTGVWVGTVVVAMVFAIGLFFLLPLGLTSLIKGQLGSSALFWIVEG